CVWSGSRRVRAPSARPVGPAGHHCFQLEEASVVNRPGAPSLVVKRNSGRRRGEQPGHPPHLKQLLPPKRVSVIQTVVRCRSERSDAALRAQPSPHDPEPTRFQTIEFPPVVATVTKYQGHARTCPECGEVTCAAIPLDLLPHSVGPWLTATLSYLAGCHGV